MADGGARAPDGTLHAAAIDALRERGAHRLDPVRFRFIEALARRSSAHDGEARRLLDERLAALLAATAARLEQADEPRPESGRPCTATHRTALAELVDRLAHAPSEGEEHAQSQIPTPDGHPPELRTLRAFRSTWSRLSADQRLAQSMAKVPGNAGPLNSHHLVHRSLTLMRELSPEYVHRFMAQVDALLWLEAASGGAVPAVKDPPRSGGERRASRAR